jgi:protein-L-isoaspartate(D-aspartate) O-methyltransferase
MGSMVESDELTQARERMIDDQIRGRGIKDARVLEAMAKIPRHVFVPAENTHLAYADAPLPIGHRQTISQPFIVALMTELLKLQGDEIVLEVGTGSGYQAAILSRLAKHVYSLERIPELAENASMILDALQIENVEVLVTDGSQGLPEHAPFGGIMVTAAAPKVPEPLKEQLADGGRLVLPVGEQAGQILECWERQGDDFRRDRVAPVAFVPLVGEHGWDSDERPFSWWL